METTFAALASMVWALPAALFQIVAIVVAVVFWNKHSSVSLMVLAAASLSLLSIAVRGMQTAWQVTAMRDGLDSTQMMTRLTAFGVVQVLLGLAAGGLMLFAAFGWRER